MTNYVTVYLTLESFNQYRNVGRTSGFLKRQTSSDVEVIVPFSSLEDEAAAPVAFGWVDNTKRYSVKADYRVYLNRMKDIPEGGGFR